MKIATLLLGTILTLSFSEPCQAQTRPGTSSSSENELVGDFFILAFAKDDSFVLTNNVTYKPDKDHYVKISKDWELDDPVRVLTTKHRNKFILINLRNGETIKTKVLVLG